MSVVDASTAAARPRFEVQVLRDERIPTGDPGVTLSADVYLPLGADQAPALVTVLPYRKDFHGQDEPTLRWFAEHGYGCLLVDNAGLGSSDGLPHDPWSAGETDDAVAAITWAAAQPWCDGNIGMWGISHGGFTSMGAASRGLPELKAVVAISFGVDVERGVMHPDGARGDFGPLFHWGGSMLMQQLLPPLVNFASAAEQRRWRRRLHATTPFLVDLAWQRAGDPAWRKRTIRPETIDVPALCVTGWRDPNCAATIRAYELVQGPKRLMVGPWMHTLPHDSPFGAIDFLPIALRWWDHWLRGADDRLLEEPPVSLYVEGDGGWRSYESWPPPSDEVVVATSADTTLAAPAAGHGRGAGVIAEYEPDPTVGALSGLWGFATTGFGLPVDQHDDDARALPATSRPLPEDTVIAGAPNVAVTLATDGATPPRLERLVVKLADVDPDGRSTLITTGVLCPDGIREVHDIVLRPIAYRLRAGHRLRVVLGDSDFPRLTPLIAPRPFAVVAIETRVPVVAPTSGAAIDVPTVEPPDADPDGGWWTITRDPVRDAVEVAIASRIRGQRTTQHHVLDVDVATRAAVRRGAPEEAFATGRYDVSAHMASGERIDVGVRVRCTQFAVSADGEVTVDGATVFRRNWGVPLDVDSEAERG
ncbi:MAG: uncharacterized protein V7607_5018 [Solirubrobacteraceae bacterium]